MRRALLVEDDRACAVGAMHILLAFGFVVERFDDARRATMAIAGKRFAVYIVDWTLRDGDAAELVRKIRHAHPDARIIIWSASECDESMIRLATFVPKDKGGRSLRIALEAMFGESNTGRGQ